MGRSELVSLIEQLSEYQIEQVRKVAEGYLGVQKQLNDNTPKSCPCCKSTTARFIKKGFSGRKQRYQCMSCGLRRWKNHCILPSERGQMGGIH